MSDHYSPLCRAKASIWPNHDFGARGKCLRCGVDIPLPLAPEPIPKAKVDPPSKSPVSTAALHVMPAMREWAKSRGIT